MFFKGYVELKKVSRSEITICNGSERDRDSRFIWTMTSIYDSRVFEAFGNGGFLIWGPKMVGL